MFLRGVCKKCKGIAVFDVEYRTDEEVKKFLESRDFGECPAGGWHVELGKIGDYIEVDFSKRFNTADEARKGKVKTYGFNSKRGSS